MRKLFDPTGRNLIEMGPDGWMAFLGNPISGTDRVKVIDSNISTVTADADKVLWVEDPEPWIQHIELQAGRDLGLEKRGHKYSALLSSQHGVPVRTALVLLRPAADGPELTGVFEQNYRNGEVYDWFRYDVVRVWRQPVDLFLTGGLTVLPLAPVSDVGLEKLPGVLIAISDRLARETSPEQAAILWNATQILMGLRYTPKQIESFIEGVPAMLFGIRGIEESSVYQAILEKGEAKGLAKGLAEGRIEDAREVLLRQGRKKFGPPGENVEAEINSLADLDRLHDLIDRVLEVSTWDELLSLPGPLT